ncbi:MAG: AAA family ATPase, partial [Chloroflexi bacterium]|nr:AAA family ATPase [Chloroflexota bacterium]
MSKLGSIAIIPVKGWGYPEHSMYCANLSLVNFRNYVRLGLELPPDVTVVLGDNAQGKSNLLEAIYYLATTRSFRASSDRELLNWLASSDETPFARLVA